MAGGDHSRSNKILILFKRIRWHLQCSAINPSQHLSIMKILLSRHALLHARLTALPVLALAALLTACNSGISRLNCVDEPKNDSAEIWSKDSRPIKINIGVDGSGSMLGFVSGNGTRFAQAIDTVSALIAAKGLTNQTSFWRLGSNGTIQKPQKISETQFLDARSPQFFCTGAVSKYPCVTSTLSQLLEIPISSPQDRLDVLLTDLEPDSGAIATLAKRYSQLIKSYPDYKIMLLGIKGQFNGTIYPAQNGAFKPFWYSSEALPIDRKGRPFYVLLSGPTSAVDNFVEAFKKMPMGVSQALRASIFTTPGNKEDIITLDNTASWGWPTNRACLSEITAFDRKIPSNPSQWLLGSIESACLGKPFDLQLKSVTSNRLPTSVIPLTQIELSPQSGGYRLLSSEVSNGRLVVGLKINPKLLSSTEPIAIHVSNQTLNSALWSDWDSGISNPSGHTTQNLLLFINSLQAISPKSADRPAIKLCLGVEPTTAQGGQPKRPPVLIFVILAAILLTGAIATALVSLDANED